jgi:predicted flap endonuclease-1-like 5' DNA nuclease
VTIDDALFRFRVRVFAVTEEMGSVRAAQIVALRPFSSLDELTRVSGIGPSHLNTIKGQGLACVD